MFEVDIQFKVCCMCSCSPCVKKLEKESVCVCACVHIYKHLPFICLPPTHVSERFTLPKATAHTVIIIQVPATGEINLVG